MFIFLNFPIIFCKRRLFIVAFIFVTALNTTFIQLWIFTRWFIVAKLLRHAIPDKGLHAALLQVYPRAFVLVTLTRD